jgi:hypothetical protein
MGRPVLVVLIAMVVLVGVVAAQQILNPQGAVRLVAPSPTPSWAAQAPAPGDLVSLDLEVDVLPMQAGSVYAVPAGRWLIIRQLRLSGFDGDFDLEQQLNMESTVRLSDAVVAGDPVLLDFPHHVGLPFPPGSTVMLYNRDQFEGKSCRVNLLGYLVDDI